MFDFLKEPADKVAPRLLGCELVRELDGHILRGKIVETEAYDQTDAASHSYRGRTPRTDVMFGPAGHLYVYFTYGMHYCCNVVVGEQGYGAAVLIRAIEPLEGEAEMATRRHKPEDSVLLTNGPAKICQAFAIDQRLNGADLLNEQGVLQLVVQESVPTDMIVQTARIGITQAKDVPWRFYLRDNKFVSK